MEKLKNSAPVSLKNIKIKDEFWSNYIELVHNVVIPYQWEAINDRIPDAEPSYAIKNFRIAAGLEEGEFNGLVFQDTDLAKWLEAVAYRLETNPDRELEELVDETIGIIEKAQQKDGYLNTYFTLKEPGKRWTNLHECHELYSAGHMIEAAVAYYNATGKRKLLEGMCNFADYIDSVFGPEPEKLQSYDGHQEIELALVKLYKATGNEKYLRLSKFFIDERGKKPSCFESEWLKRNKISYWSGKTSENPSKHLDYNQAHLPVREQSEAVGHAVRAVYMYTAMADLALLNKDVKLLEACRRLWNNIVSKQLYITGGIGSTNHGEAFTFNYDLPNDIVYQETCASIGLIFFAHRMLQIDAKGEYADVLERALYNSVLSGMALNGKSFFYVNPLEVLPEASEKNPAKHHVKSVRQKWYACACCPPNVARLLASLGQYIYTVSSDTIFTHLYISGNANIEIKNTEIVLKQKTSYPRDGKIGLEVLAQKETEFVIALRIPGWCEKHSLSINGSVVKAEVVNGYARLERTWKQGDLIELELDMPVELIQAHPEVRANAGKVAIQRGPLVYCLEEEDNGRNLSAISIPYNSKLVAEFAGDLLGGVVVIKGDALKTDASDFGERLYRKAEVKEKPISIKAIPYCMWGNRKPGEMLVWIRQK